MYRLFRLALVWLLALALPMQGAAAATMISCGPHHEHMAAGVQHVSVEAATLADHHHAANAGVTSATRASPPKSADVKATVKFQSVRDGGALLTKFTCNACAACCIGAAVATSAQPLSLLRVSSTLFPSAVSSAFGFISEGPYHPPRINLV